MGRAITRGVKTALLFAACLAVSIPSQAVDSDLYLAGLGLHQETGRNIYLGGIYLERETPRPANFADAEGTRIMEYRVVARRTSIRSLLGGMLLQSEVATGTPPDQATTDFIDSILSTVNTSLYAGDSLVVRLEADNQTIALLNGYEVARVNQKSVADYLLMGWVGESGPSTTFRDDLTAEVVDPSLLSALEANTYTAQREAEIAAALNIDQQPAEEEASAVETKPEAKKTVAKVEAAPVAAAAAVASATVTETAKKAAKPAAVPAPKPKPEPVQVASLVPTEAMLPVSSLAAEVEALGIQEYSQRLSTFHSSVVGQVYGSIRYPKRAVRRNIQGRLELDVTMNREGKVLAIYVAESSGHEMLDEAAVEAAQDAFGKGLPEGVDPVAIAEFGDFDTERLTVPVPVSFRLQ